MIIHNPSAYHGHKNKRPFFEGWYHKLTTKDNRSLVIIPGIYESGQTNNKTTFVMIFDGSNGNVFFLKNMRRVNFSVTTPWVKLFFIK